MGMDMLINFENSMVMSMGIGMIFKNRYGCPEPTPRPSLLLMKSMTIINQLAPNFVLEREKLRLMCVKIGENMEYL